MIARVDPLAWFALVFLIIVATNIVGLVSVVVSFTSLRHTRFALVCAPIPIAVGAFSMCMLIVHGPGSFGPPFFWALFLIPLPLGAIGLYRWFKRNDR